MGNRRVSLVVLAVLLLLTSCTSSYMGRWVSWRSSDINDWHRFPSRSIANAPPKFTFTKSDPGADLTIRDPRVNAVGDVSLARLAEQTSTTALLVIKNDTLLFEGYYNGHGRDSVNTSFSVAKSITSLLVGVAVGEGLIASIDDSIAAYLPELGARDSRFSRITIRHLLDMVSGIRFRDHDLPWGDKPRAYYHPNLRKVLLHELEIADEPGRRWAYNSYNPQLLGLILERVSGTSVAQYMESRLWMKLGMEFPASWSLDGNAAPLEKMESGVNARAMDFAKLARLVLRRGNWGVRRSFLTHGSRRRGRSVQDASFPTFAHAPSATSMGGGSIPRAPGSAALSPPRATWASSFS